MDKLTAGEMDYLEHLIKKAVSKPFFYKDEVPGRKVREKKLFSAKTEKRNFTLAEISHCDAPNCWFGRYRMGPDYLELRVFLNEMLKRFREDLGV